MVNCLTIKKMGKKFLFIIDPKNALTSGIVLHDGTLTATEIFNLDLNVDIVTLSACESGQADLL
ncbi:MAG: CHAT domain-containing protein [Methanosarcinales archaeon]